jgi:hypothetical protein
MTEKHEVDLLVIGSGGHSSPNLLWVVYSVNDLCVAVLIVSGIYGIQAARTYLEIHPNDQVIILEAGKYPGGVWGAGEPQSQI